MPYPRVNKDNQIPTPCPAPPPPPQPAAGFTLIGALSLKIDLIVRTFSCRVWQLLFCRSALSTGWGLAHSSKIQLLIVSLNHFQKRFPRQEIPQNDIGYF